MSDTGNAVVPKVVQNEPIGLLTVQQDSKVTHAVYGTFAILSSMREMAEALVMKTPDDKAIVTEMIRQVKEVCAPVVEMIEPIKRQANEKVAKILDVEKAFVTYIPPKDAAKTRADKRFQGWQIIDILQTKLSKYLDWEDEERTKEEARLQAEAEKKRQKDLERISGQLDKMLDKVSDLNEQKRLLDERLEDQSITVEEAEEVRARIDAIEIKLRPMQDKVTDTQIRMEQKAAPVSVSVGKGPKVAGLSSDNFYWEPVEVLNIKAICREIAEGRLPPACVTVNMAKIKQAGNDQVKGMNRAPSVPGVRFEKKRKISVR